MTREEKQKAIDALKISAPVMAVTQEEFNDYIQTLNKIMNWLEQEPKTGHWRHYEGMLICSECGTEFYDDIMEYCGDDVPKCCPNCGCRMVEPQWHDSEEPPKEGEYILLSFSNFSVPLVGRYEGGAYYIGDDLTTALSQDIYVNGWQELPKCREE